MSNPHSRSKPSNDTSPEIVTTSATAGRETLVAIIEDEADQARALLEQKRRTSPPRATPPPFPPPAETPVSNGPRTLPAPTGVPPHSPTLPLSARLQIATPSSHLQEQGRPQFVTMDYQEPPRESSTPYIETGLMPMGRETLAAITTDLAQELLKALSSEERTSWLLQMDDAMVLEPFRFEVRGVPMLARPNDSLRREFVSTKLLHRLPVRTIQEVVRIDATPTADDGLTLTIWVKIPELGNP